MTMPQNTLSSIEDWFRLQGHTLDWKQRELDYAYADEYGHYSDSDPFDPAPPRPPPPVSDFYVITCMWLTLLCVMLRSDVIMSTDVFFMVFILALNCFR
jgi:hypothetical protein